MKLKKSYKYLALISFSSSFEFRVILKSKRSLEIFSVLYLFIIKYHKPNNHQICSIIEINSHFLSLKSYFFLLLHHIVNQHLHQEKISHQLIIKDNSCMTIYHIFEYIFHLKLLGKYEEYLKLIIYFLFFVILKSELFSFSIYKIFSQY